MSSTGPGSLLVFLAFLMLSTLLAGTYFTAYLGLLEAGVEVRKAGEAASEQAIVYLFQHPTNVSMVDGRPVMKGETRIVIQNVGSRDISFDRILAISPDGSVVADVKVPGNKGLGVRQWQLYKVQDLGLPERWSNFTVFSSEVSRLVLLSERGRTHGSIWGVPPFLEGILRATISTTMTTSYFYSYIETTSYQTTYTITIKAKQSRYSLTGEWWESNDGRNWYKVTSVVGRRNCHWDWTWTWHCDCRYFYVYRCIGGNCYTSSCSQQSPPALSFPDAPTSPEVFSSLTANGLRIASPDTPIILYIEANETVVVNAGVTTYTVTSSVSSCEVSDYTCNGPYCYYNNCIQYVTEHYRRYRLQAIELIDWDTGEVYASVNQTSVTFNIDRNIIVKFKYVLDESWSRTWEVIISTPPPDPKTCVDIINDPSKEGTTEWCRCLETLDRQAYDKSKCVQYMSCLYVNVDFCCSGDEKYSCLDSRSGRGGSQCVAFTGKEVEQGVTKPMRPVSWSASWSLKQGWVYDRIVQVGDSNPPYCTGDASDNSASGECCLQLDRGRCVAGNVGPNRDYRTTVVIVFRKT